ncbi:hypothetical protein C8Q77DRAFT_1057428 [Trametes polyzona]|nr:hypothetical protein C8Q77DRAFT_1057428 [Trametes polyzona]
MGLLGDLLGALAKCLCGGIKEETLPQSGHTSDIYIPPQVPHGQQATQQQPAPIYPPTQPQYQPHPQQQQHQQHQYEYQPARPEHEQHPAGKKHKQHHRPHEQGHGQSPDPNQVNQHNEYYVGLRARANAAGDEMARSFEEAHQAYERGDGALAKELSNKGKAAQKEMERLNEEASEWIFRENNTDSQPGEIDLHGLYVKEAIRYADRSIQEARARGDSKIRFIVGKGLHSAGGVAKLKPAIEELMQKHGLVAEMDEHNAGVLIVNLDGQTSGRGRVLRPDDITRGLERKEDGCTIM